MRGYSIDQAREARDESRRWQQDKLLREARKRFPRGGDIDVLDRFAVYLDDLACDYAADGEWPEARKHRTKAEECRELIEALEEEDE